MKHQSAFTLIELLLSLAIAALISVGTLQLFQTSLGAKDVIDEQSGEFAAMNRAMRLIEQDMIQVAPMRDVRDPYGEYSAAVDLSFDGLYLTRAGWSQSTFMTYERSSLQRVHYRLAEPGSDLCPWLEDDDRNDAGGCLVRSFRTHLDDDGYLTWQHQVLLRPVSTINWQFLVAEPGGESEFKNEPPQADPRDDVKRNRLKAILFSLEANGREYSRLFRTPSMPFSDEEDNS